MPVAPILVEICAPCFSTSHLPSAGNWSHLGHFISVSFIVQMAGQLGACGRDVNYNLTKR